MLRGASVRRLVDVRRWPGSRRHPHFARANLEKVLPREGIAYAWCEVLGGRRTSDPGASRHQALRVTAFRSYADHLDSPQAIAALERLRASAATAIMCAETLWWRCHRRLIADALTVAGARVVHVLDRRTSQEHRLHDAARLDERGRIVYDAGAVRLG